FALVGASVHADNIFPRVFTYTLPFSFPFYDSSYTNVVISNTGTLRFGGSVFPEPGTSTSNSEATLLNYAMIAPLWGNILTNQNGNDIFIDTSVANQVTIRWFANNA